MASERRNIPEQERSIKEREQQLFEESPSEPAAPTTMPFETYLRRTPADPISPQVKAILWATAVIVFLLFGAALWRVSRSRSARPGPAPSSSSKRVFLWPDNRSGCPRPGGDGTIRGLSA